MAASSFAIVAVPTCWWRTSKGCVGTARPLSTACLSRLCETSRQSSRLYLRATTTSSGIELHGPARLLYVYIEPTELRSALNPASSLLNPRRLFEDAALWSTITKLRGLLQSPLPDSLRYFEALGAVLMHELVRLNSGPSRGETPARGGLATWQQRLVVSYIEEHVSEPISLATLAHLARLSPYHFSRAFKQSFGVPPHRYHTNRRIELAKTLLEKRAFSVTDIGSRLGFSETSSFTAAFRKTTGLTPSRYHRSITHGHDLVVLRHRFVRRGLDCMGLAQQGQREKSVRSSTLRRLRPSKWPSPTSCLSS